MGLNFKTFVCQSYDDASSMAIARVGPSEKYLEEAHLAFDSHCTIHCLNRIAAQVVTIPDVSNAQSVIKEVSARFRSSAKRTDLLDVASIKLWRQHSTKGIWLRFARHVLLSNTLQWSLCFRKLFRRWMRWGSGHPQSSAIPPIFCSTLSVRLAS